MLIASSALFMADTGAQGNSSEDIIPQVIDILFSNCFLLSFLLQIISVV